jgi:hypothetical protein
MMEVHILRSGRSPAAWAHAIMRAMSRWGSTDPLLRFHLAELVRLNGRRLDAIRARCREDLVELRAARNALVHAEDLLLAEQRTSYLASLATEIVLLQLEAAGAAGA